MLRSFYSESIRPSLAAKAVGCSARVAQKYYSVFRGVANVGRGRRPRKIAEVPGPTKHVTESYVGPVPHRPCPPPNCIPSITREMLMSGRAR